jgi:hypothetical protein
MSPWYELRYTWPQVSTLCVREDLVAAGGFGGELVVKRLGEEKLAYAGRITARSVSRSQWQDHHRTACNFTQLGLQSL